MCQMEFANVSIQGWIIDPYVKCFLDCSDKVLVLPLHYAEIIYGDIMTSDVKMVIYWGRGLMVFSKPLSKCS